MRVSQTEAESSRQPGVELQTAIRPPRDPRIDLARGVALWFIFIDHVGFNPVAQWTLRRYWFIDALDVFIFLSGYSLGRAYGREFDRSGAKACLVKALKRCRTLYLWHVGTALAFFGLLYTFASYGVRPYPPDLYALLREPWPTCAWLLTLAHTPHLLNILPLYMLLTLFTPIALIGFSKWPVRLVTFSVLLYAAVQVYPEINLRSYPGNTPWPWSVFAWQFPFLVSLWVGRATAAGKGWRWLDSRRVALGSLMGLALMFIARRAVKMGLLLKPYCGAWIAGSLAYLQITLPETNKTTADPVRLLNLIVFLVAARAVVNWLQLHRRSIFRPVILCGQHSLPVFAAGLFLSDLFTLMGHAGLRGPLYWVTINLVGLILLSLVAQIASRVRRMPLTIRVKLAPRG